MRAKTTEGTIRLGSRLVTYSVRRSDRATRLRLRVIPGHGLEVVLPRGFTLREAAAFVRREQAWVLRHLDTAVAAPPVSLADGSRIPCLGETLVICERSGATNRVRRAGETLYVTRCGPATTSSIVEAWFRAEARRIFRERAAHHAAALGVTFGRIAVKDTRSRWGSCSAKGNLNFSWRLLLAPYAVMDYVVAHEVAHLRELNHSPRFWEHVALLCPDYRTHRIWLRRHGSTLAAWPGQRAG